MFVKPFIPLVSPWTWEESPIQFTSGAYEKRSSQY
jgi:hypothetical protein